MIYPTAADIKVFWDWGVYTLEIMREYVSLKVITKEEFEQITGVSFDKPATSADLGTTAS
ncbi:XkdX family protein [Bacillus pumilus]|uniref:XkdX family protein n=1 Tax=Bacillus pumilus TaxID=1408 RepID=UPI00203EAB63|nr:XkdX family protein [Bacillus pumilus]MCM3148490.1 XkdX family protein [Bacillus pumilus]MCY7573959.1 XkdX family protein [Bacillus pumilus]MCY7577556.1 XkdX family protein [Bacillus pumilus]MEC3761049.1 XkdX family protein [Bacillus pumilus]